MTVAALGCLALHQHLTSEHELFSYWVNGTDDMTQTGSRRVMALLYHMRKHRAEQGLCINPNVS